MTPIKSVCIIGAGTMGQGITQVCASAGFEVLLYDRDIQIVKSAIAKIEAALQTQVAKNKLTSTQKDDVLSRITPIASLKKIQSQLVIEAAVEDLEIKRKIFEEVEASVGDETILASNTSSISITQIASKLRHAERLAGLHFFNPAPVMKLVEIIQGASTSAATVQTLRDFCVRVNKQVVVAQDSPGFVVNRVARHFYVEALKLAEENVADIKTIDELMQSAGFKMGPFELMDLIGIDVNFAVTSSLYEGFHQEPRFRPSRLQQKKVDAGELGKKSGRGFYDYRQ